MLLFTAKSPTQYYGSSTINPMDSCTCFSFCVSFINFNIKNLKFKLIVLRFLFYVEFVVQGLLLPQPTYSGPQKILYFRDAKTFKEEIGKDRKAAWLIEFYTAWNPSCVNFAPLFAEISEKYVHKFISILCVSLQ